MAIVVYNFAMSKEKLICLTDEEIKLRRSGGAVFSFRSACRQCRRVADIGRYKERRTDEEVDLCVNCSYGLPKTFKFIGWMVTVIRRGRRG